MTRASDGAIAATGDRNFRPLDAAVPAARMAPRGNGRTELAIEVARALSGRPTTTTN